MLLSISSGTDSFLQFLTILLLFVFVLGITWATTRWIAKIQKGQMLNGTNLEVVESMHISGNKYIQIVRAGKKYLVIAQGKDEVHFLAELNEDEIIVKDSAENSEISFSKVFDKIKDLKKKSHDED